MKKLPRAGGAGRLSVARGVYRLSGGSFFKDVEDATERRAGGALSRGGQGFGEASRTFPRTFDLLLYPPGLQWYCGRVIAATDRKGAAIGG
jgi:hypothetical protein